jgi:2-methylisocitrate lyase-like PEP mutase family enzyme
MTGTPADLLRDRLMQGRILAIPGAFDAMSARLVEEAGFEAVYASGAGIANAYLAAPDLGLLSPDEFFGNLRAIVDATTLPVIADLDTGHGGVHNVARAMREAERAGAAAVQFEDQAFPKRCGHFAGKSLISAHEMSAKILAAGDSRRNPATVLIARTDAIAPEGFDAAIERALLYRAAGADVVFIEALETAEQIRIAAAAVPGPKLINLVEGGLTPFLPLEDLERLGYRIALFANFALRAAMKAMGEALGKLREQGTSAALLDQIVDWEERQRLVSLGEFERRDRRWAAAANALRLTRHQEDSAE